MPSNGLELKLGEPGDQDSRHVDRDPAHARQYPALMGRNSTRVTRLIVNCGNKDIHAIQPAANTPLNNRDLVAIRIIRSGIVDGHTSGYRNH